MAETTTFLPVTDEGSTTNTLNDRLNGTGRPEESRDNCSSRAAGSPVLHN